MPEEPETLTFRCAACGETNELALDPDEGAEQELVTDCWVCCRPNRVRISNRGGGRQIQVALDA